MNGLIWSAQVALAVAFLLAGGGKLLAYEPLAKLLQRRARGGELGVSRGQAAVIGVVEIAGALGVLMPEGWSPDYLLVRVAAAGLALLMVFAGIYHTRRREAASPAVTLFLLALFVIVGRWPR
jgi:hypothetical protein